MSCVAVCTGNVHLSRQHGSATCHQPMEPFFFLPFPNKPSLHKLYTNRILEQILVIVIDISPRDVGAQIQKRKKCPPKCHRKRALLLKYNTVSQDPSDVYLVYYKSALLRLQPKPANHWTLLKPASINSIKSDNIVKQGYKMATGHVLLPYLQQNHLFDGKIKLESKVGYKIFQTYLFSFQKY